MIGQDVEYLTFSSSPEAKQRCEIVRLILLQHVSKDTLDADVTYDVSDVFSKIKLGNQSLKAQFWGFLQCAILMQSKWIYRTCVPPLCS